MLPNPVLGYRNTQGSLYDSGDGDNNSSGGGVLPWLAAEVEGR